jgi:hypothetical protein
VPPDGVLGLVATVSVEFVPGPINDGLNAPDVPAGNPLTLKLTAPLNPFTAPALST